MCGRGADVRSSGDDGDSWRSGSESRERQHRGHGSLRRRIGSFLLVGRGFGAGEQAVQGGQCSAGFSYFLIGTSPPKNLLVHLHLYDEAFVVAAAAL